MTEQAPQHDTWAHQFYLGQWHAWHENWQTIPAKRDELMREGYTLRAQLRRLVPTREITDSLSVLNERLGAGKSRAAPEAFLRSAIRKLEEASARFDTDDAVEEEAPSVLLDILEGVAESLDFAGGSEAGVALETVIKHGDFLAGTGDLARDLKRAYKSDVEPVLSLILAAVLVSEEDTERIASGDIKGAWVRLVRPDSPSDPQDDEVSSGNLRLEDLNAACDAAGLRIAAEDTGTPVIETERLADRVRWIAFAGTTEAARGMLEWCGGSLTETERQSLDRVCQEEREPAGGHRCWLLLTIKSSDPRVLRNSIALGVRLIPRQDSESVLGGLNADTAFRAAVRQARLLAGEFDIDGKTPWDLTGLGIVPQRGADHALVGASAGLAIFSNIGWARRGIRPTAPVAFTGALVDGRIEVIDGLEDKLDAAKQAGIQWVVTPADVSEAQVDRGAGLIRLPRGKTADEALRETEMALAEVGVHLVPDEDRWKEWIDRAQKLAMRLESRGEKLCSLAEPLYRLWRDTPAGPHEQRWLLFGTKVGAAYGRALLLSGRTVEAWDVFKHTFEYLDRMQSQEEIWIFIGTFLNLARQFGLKELPPFAAFWTDRIPQLYQNVEPKVARHMLGSYGVWLTHLTAIVREPSLRRQEMEKAEYWLKVKHKLEVEYDRIHQPDLRLCMADWQLAQLYDLCGRYEEAGTRLLPVRSFVPASIADPKMKDSGDGQSWLFVAVEASRWLSLCSLANQPAVSQEWRDWMQAHCERIRSGCLRFELLQLLACFERSMLIMSGSGSGRIPDAVINCMSLLADRREQGRYQIIACGFASAVAVWLMESSEPGASEWLDRARDFARLSRNWYAGIERVDRLIGSLDALPAPALRDTVQQIIDITLF